MIKNISYLFIFGLGTLCGYLGFKNTSTHKNHPSSVSPSKETNSSAHNVGSFDLKTRSQSSKKLAILINDYEGLSSEDLRTKFHELMTLSRAEKAIALPVLFAAWSETDPAGALLASKQLDGEKDSIIALVLETWAEEDPRSAADFYKRHAAGLFTRNYLNAHNQVSGSEILVHKLTELDSDFAFKWARELNDLADRNHAIKTFFESLAATDPKQALKLADALPREKREQAIGGLIKHWVISDSDAAVDWVNSLEEHELSTVIPQFIAGLATKDPTLASDYLEYVNGNRDESIRMLLDPWMNRDPQLAADLLVQKTSDVEQEGFMKTVMDRWIDREPEAAKQWALDQEAGNSRDVAIEAYVASTLNGVENYEDLMNLADNQIKDKTLRDRAIKNTIVAWAIQDREAAESYVDKAGLSREAIGDFYYEANAVEPLD